MPLRQARSGTRGRPPFRLGFAGDKRGSIKSHKPSGTNAAALTVHLPAGTMFRAAGAQLLSSRVIGR